jgi:hypothetical protein
MEGGSGLVGLRRLGSKFWGWYVRFAFMHCAASNYLLGRSGLEIFVANLWGLAWNESGWDV